MSSRHAWYLCQLGAVVELNHLVPFFCNDQSCGLQDRSKRVWTPVALLRSHSDTYPWERYEPPYPSSNGLNNTITVLEGSIWHHITWEGWYAIKQQKQTNKLIMVKLVSVSSLYNKGCFDRGVVLFTDKVFACISYIYIYIYIYICIRVGWFFTFLILKYLTYRWLCMDLLSTHTKN